jgi:GNAT superfamily N-acetyltransferase
LADVQIREITGTDKVPLTFRLRYAVWNDEAELTADVRAQKLITDDHDRHARHRAAFDGEEIVAAARMCVHKVQEDSPDARAFSKIRLAMPVATINRLVVAPRARRLGIAKQLDECRISAAKHEGAKCVVGTAAPARIDALETLGFRLTGEQWVQSYCVSPAMHAMVLML